MTNTDHEQEARKRLATATRIELPLAGLEIAEAQVHATLALVEAVKELTKRLNSEPQTS